MVFICRWQSDLTETEEVKISHAVTNFEVSSLISPLHEHIFYRSRLINSFCMSHFSLHQTTTQRMTSASSATATLETPKCTRCSSPVINSKCSRLSSPSTGACRTKKAAQRGANTKTISTESTLRFSSAKCLLVITKIL